MEPHDIGGPKAKYDRIELLNLDGDGDLICSPAKNAISMPYCGTKIPQ